MEPGGSRYNSGSTPAPGTWETKMNTTNKIPGRGDYTLAKEMRINNKYF